MNRLATASSIHLDSRGNRAPLGFWVLAAALVVYVAACTGFRDNRLDADAWEHHGAVLALTQHFWNPGNPAFAGGIPSVRYSPYTVGQALICRALHVDPYNALSAAAVFNTILLVIGVWLLLREFGEAASAGAVLLVMVSLYGGVPSYANSYALADLPCRQVDPSAFSFGLMIVSWALFRRAINRGRVMLTCLVLVPLASCAMLDHAVTGAFGMMGLFVLALTGPAATRRRMIVCVAVVGLAAGSLCLAWPWYSFLAVVRFKGNGNEWFDPAILQLMLTRWCAPAVLCGLFVLPLRKRPLVGFCLLGGAAAVVLGLVAWPFHSALLARFPLPGLIFFHMAIGLFVHESAILSWRTWPGRIRAMLSTEGSTSSGAILQTTVAVLLIFFLLPQLRLVASQPYLAGTYVAKAMHRRDKQVKPEAELSALLHNIAVHDVVLSDPQTSWLIPSVRGRIVWAIHDELLVPDQAQRRGDLEAFFADNDEGRRVALLRKYNVKWILLDARQLDAPTFAGLRRESAIARRDGNMVLMDADAWIVAGTRSSTRARGYLDAPSGSEAVAETQNQKRSRIAATHWPGCIGVSVGAMRDYGTDRPFCNLYLYGREWVDPVSHQPAALSPNGYPLADAVILWALCDPLPGVYYYRFTGVGKLNFNGGGFGLQTNVAVTGSGADRVTTGQFTLTRNAGASVAAGEPTNCWCEMTNIDPNNPPDNLQIAHESYGPLATLPLFTPEFLNSLAPFGIIRLDWWCAANGWEDARHAMHPNTMTNWSDRPLPGRPQTGPNGVCVEYQVALINALCQRTGREVDAWISVPAPATNAFVTSLAQAWLSGAGTVSVGTTSTASAGTTGVNSKCVLHFEGTNEPWNSGFPQFAQLRELAAANPALTPADVDSQYGIYQELCWLLRQWKQDFLAAGWPAARIKCILAGQAVSPSWCNLGLAYLQRTAAAGQTVDYVAYADYWGPGAAWDVAGATLDGLFAATTANIADPALYTSNANLGYIRSYMTVARTYGISGVVTYEGGIAFGSAGIRTRSNMATATAAQLDPRMAQCYLQDMQQAFANGLVKYVHLGNVGQWGRTFYSLVQQVDDVTNSAVNLKWVTLANMAQAPVTTPTPASTPGLFGD